jgi:transcriptional regulator with XRE-family HTH domain
MARTPKARALGAALRAEREARKLTTRALAERIGRNQGEISRWETGERATKPENVAQILTALGLTGERYDEIMSLAYDTGAPLWVATSLPAQRQQLAAFVDAEQSATDVIEVSPLLIPGLVQTADYMRAIMSGGGLLSPDEIVTRVAIRMGRRDALTRAEPVRFTALIGEAAIHQVVGDLSVLVGQLQYLLTVAQWPNVTVRVIPFDSGWHPALEGAFTVFRSENSVPMAHVEVRRTGLFFHEESDVAGYMKAAELAATVALDPRASVDLVTKAIADKERQT